MNLFGITHDSNKIIFDSNKEDDPVSTAMKDTILLYADIRNVFENIPEYPSENSSHIHYNVPGKTLDAAINMIVDMDDELIEKAAIYDGIRTALRHAEHDIRPSAFFRHISIQRESHNEIILSSE
jgi:hypothetical protein